MPESIYPPGRSKQYLIGESERTSPFPGNSIRSWRIEAPSFSAMPQWLDALLHQQENHHEVILYRAGAKYNLDLRRLPEDNRRFFLTLYDNPTRTSLIQGEFEIRGGALFLPHLSDRGKNNVKNLFKGQEFLTNLGGREPNSHPFDRFGRIWGEEKPENNKLTKA